MERAHLKLLTEPDLTVSLRPARPPLAVANEVLVPEPFWKSYPPKGGGEGGS